MTRRALVTGASGFIGRHCLGPLADRGFEVHGVATRAMETGGPETWHRCDLFDEDDVVRLLEEVRPSHLLHLAWYTAPGLYWESSENLGWLRASLALMEGFERSGGRRMVVSGTCAEYDWSHGSCREGVTPLAPSTLYGACKNALQSVTAAWGGRSSLSTAWGRLFFLYGPRERPGRLVPSIVQSLLDGEVARCSHGRQHRDFLDVRDAADAFASILDNEVEGPVNIGSGVPVAIADIVRMIGARVPGTGEDAFDFGAVSVPLDDPPLLVADIRRLAEEVGWRPKIELGQGLSDAVSWWRDHGKGGLA